VTSVLQESSQAGLGGGLYAEDEDQGLNAASLLHAFSMYAVFLRFCKEKYVDFSSGLLHLQYHDCAALD